MEVRKDAQKSGGLDAFRGVGYHLERTPLASVQRTVVSLGCGVLGRGKGADDFRRQLSVPFSLRLWGSCREQDAGESVKELTAWMAGGLPSIVTLALQPHTTVCP